MKTRKIGEIFTVEKSFWQVVEGGDCSKCTLLPLIACTSNSRINVLSGACSEDFRSDGENVHFEKIGNVDPIYEEWTEYSGLIHRKVNANSWFFSDEIFYFRIDNYEKKKSFAKNTAKYKKRVFNSQF